MKCVEARIGLASQAGLPAADFLDRRQGLTGYCNAAPALAARHQSDRGHLVATVLECGRPTFSCLRQSAAHKSGRGHEYFRISRRCSCSPVCRLRRPGQTNGLWQARRYRPGNSGCSSKCRKRPFAIPALWGRSFHRKAGIEQTATSTRFVPNFGIGGPSIASIATIW